MEAETIQLTLPDGRTLVFPAPITPGEVARAIGPRLAAQAIAARADERLVDLDCPLDRDTRLSLILPDSPDGLSILRHSASHLMAQAVKELFPDAQVTIGPAVENGFYYDFDLARPLTPEDLTVIEERMRELAKRNLPIRRRELTREEAIQLFEGMGERYKAEIIRDLPGEEPVSLYQQGTFVDLCRGPHLPATGRLKAFKLMRVAGAYWRGDAKNRQLQRIYGTAWADLQALQNHLHLLEEAARRDHRRIGKEMDLFSLQEDAGGGLVFWHPLGSRVRMVIETFWKERHQAAGYEFLYTPHLADLTLWRTSGHLDFYTESMFKPMLVDEQPYQIRPMNCPFHILIYRDRPRSYRELPIRWAELGTVYRYELSGVLHGLFRVRGFTQDDAHIFCRLDQIEQEIQGILDLTLEILSTYGFDAFEVNLSTRPAKSVGSDAIWEQATEALRKAVEERKLPYTEDVGGGAFYGPKIDVKITDAIGRKWQCSTIQLDFNLPERFDMVYTGEDGARHRPIMIHRALMGSLERFFGILIEHYVGRFPLWLAPVQAMVTTITERHNPWAVAVQERLGQAGLRVEADLRNEKIGFKIREHTLRNVPYLLIVGDREQENGTVTLRNRAGEDLGSHPLASVVERLLAEAKP